MFLRNFVRISTCGLLLAGWAAPASGAGWNAHTVRQLNGAGPEINLPAKLQIVTEDAQPWSQWHQIAVVPGLVYMPEQDRLLMSVGCDYPHQAMLISSNDHGATWSQPWYLHVNGGGTPDVGLSTGLTYLGQGKLAINGGNYRWFSQDYGTTWGNPVAVGPTPDGMTWYDGWSPMLVERAQTGAITRLVETGYTALSYGHQQAYYRTSTNLGSSWSAGVQVPQWQGVSEVALIRAANGNLVAACRTDAPPEYQGQMDFYEGLGVSVSDNGGSTWSPVQSLYAYGRHHPSLVLMPNNDIVMTYVVRAGYPDTPDGHHQFGIEAVVSHDNGNTWDLDHRYVLNSWVSSQPSSGSNWWYGFSQQTSSALLPDGSILTAFGTSYRQTGLYGGSAVPRDVGLVLWHPIPEPSTLVLAGTALLTLAGHLWRKRR